MAIRSYVVFLPWVGIVRARGNPRSRHSIPTDDKHFGTTLGIGIATEH
jgi:hypothetical protein